MLRRDASPSAPLVLAQAAETKVVVAAVEENRELWRSVLIAFLVGVFTAAWIIFREAELELYLRLWLRIETRQSGPSNYISTRVLPT